MIERQPRNEDIIAAGPDGLAHGPQVGEQIGVAEHHALGVPRAAGGILQKGDILCSSAVQQGDRLMVQFRGGQHFGQRRRLGPQQCGYPFRLRHGDDEYRFGIGEDACVPPQVILDLRQSCRRIDRHRNAAGKHHAEEARQIVASGGQHQRHRLPRQQAARHQSGGDAARLFEHFAIGEAFGTKLARLAPDIAVEQHVRTLRMAFGMPLEDFDQRPRHSGTPVGLCSGCRGFDGRCDQTPDAGTRNESQQVLWRFGLGKRPFRQ
jgi:hypothetical protein